MLDSATKLSKAVEADGILVPLERATDLKRLKKKCSNHVLIVATTEESIQQAVAELEINVIPLEYSIYITTIPSCPDEVPDRATWHRPWQVS